MPRPYVLAVFQAIVEIPDVTPLSDEQLQKLCDQADDAFDRQLEFLEAELKPLGLTVKRGDR